MPGGEQIDVFVGAVEAPVCGDRMPAGQREPVPAANLQGDLRQPAMDRQGAVGHGLARRYSARKHRRQTQGLLVPSGVRVMRWP